MGMSLPAAYRRIVVPQALLVAVPTLGGYFIGLLKDLLPARFYFCIGTNALGRHAGLGKLQAVRDLHGRWARSIWP